ncbi:BnaC05g49590D [Brassica napus]|uniref:(rape) hypothetical protein n=1 Tax=Brassica napus TaxID=3708 RepID=A0A078IP85_BRANA|nr:unnamed protein product [Brassica napus]CDY51776.1 BnaC05g49590D [Brassica napus]
MRIKGGGNYSCRLKFKEQSVKDRNPRQVVHVFVQDNRTGEKVAILIGKWDEAMYYVLGDPTTKPKGYDLMTAAITLGMMDKLPSTDSRLRPDQRHLENGEYHAAKLRLAVLETGTNFTIIKLEKGWKPRWFGKDEGDYRYLGGYWKQERRNIGTKITDIFKKQQQRNTVFSLFIIILCFRSFICFF